MAKQNQFSLLRENRFAPFFWTQFLGAANDNLRKFAITLLITYRLQLDWLPTAQVGALIGGLFILPFLVFSATSGQVADKWDRQLLIRGLKWFELLVMGIACVGLLTHNAPMMLFTVFLMGTQSAVFGPVKFAYLPQHLRPDELTGGNGLVEMGTFTAIILVNICGGLLMDVGELWVCVGVLSLSALGLISAHRIPSSPPLDPGLRINWNPVSETWRNLKLASKQVAVFRSLLGISWMWFVGALFLSLFPAYAKDVLHGNEHVALLLLCMFSIGVGVGSLLCESLSRHQVEIGLVPMGAFFMGVAAIDLSFASEAFGAVGAQTAPLGVWAFVQHPGAWRVLLDLVLLSFASGIYVVPMYALIQLRTPPTHRARIIAANNIINALFMVASALMAGVLLSLGWRMSEIFLFVGIATFAVATYIFLLVPEYLMRFVAWMITHFIYRFEVRGSSRVPGDGAAILIANHVSYVDAILISAVSPRPVRFIMDHRIFQAPLLGWLFRLNKAIPVAPKDEAPEVYARAMAQAQETLNAGDLLGIFPEGALSRDGTLQAFKGGVLKILEDGERESGASVPVIPMGLNSVWGSIFCRGGARQVRWRRPVSVEVGEALTRDDLKACAMRQRVADLLVTG